jgi:hypothetical protein
VKYEHTSGNFTSGPATQRVTSNESLPLVVRAHSSRDEKWAPGFGPRDLEVVLQSQLNLPLWDCDGGYDAGAARAVVDEVVGLGEVGVVEGVE